MRTRPEVITLCGSTQFREQFFETQERLTLEGKIVFSVGVFVHADGKQISAEQKQKLDELHLRKIDLSDGIYVIDVNGYIGESTRREIKYARKEGKFVRFYSVELQRKNEHQ